MRLGRWDSARSQRALMTTPRCQGFGLQVRVQEELRGLVREVTHGQGAGRGWGSSSTPMGPWEGLQVLTRGAGRPHSPLCGGPGGVDGVRSAPLGPARHTAGTGEVNCAREQSQA